MRARDRLIIALDVLEEKKAIELIVALSPEVDLFKVGIGPFTAFGKSILKRLEEEGKKVFLDLKFHDIPNTVKNAACAAAEQGVYMMNFHCVGGGKMLASAVAGAEEGAKKRGTKRPLLIGVTVLTSMDEAGLAGTGIFGGVEENVIRFAGLAKEAGLDGVVASAEETRMIKEKFGDGFLVVTPGIRPEWSVSGDQKRSVTPAEAIKNGSDLIVVGRPVIQAKDPLAAAKRILEEMTDSTGT